MKVNFNIDNQIITRIDHNIVIANSIDFLEAECDFSADWNGADKTIQFRNGDIIISIRLVNDEVTQDDHLNLSVGTWKVCIIGYKDDTRIVTNEVNLTVYASGKDRVTEAYTEIITKAVNDFIDENAEEIIYRLLNEQGISFGQVDDVKVDNVSVVESRIASIDMEGYLADKQNKVIFGTTAPTSAVGFNGDQYVRYNTDGEVLNTYFKKNGLWLPLIADGDNVGY